MAIAYQDLGNWQQSAAGITKATELLETVKDDFLYAQFLNIQGSLQGKTGEL
ncbi:MAG: hypothetical protein QNJ70_31655 [Xenococcaceae cyanobacterium MO_207.B15]|nr:hypothetical protein [Xenococcaceae cyanobacterium MO_207.B15]